MQLNVNTHILKHMFLWKMHNFTFIDHDYLYMQLRTEVTNISTNVVRNTVLVQQLQNISTW
jgi:hypothetical protein